jgi:hypothetical protein
VASRILRSKFARDGRGVDIVFDGGRVKSRLSGDWLRGAIWDSLGETAFSVSLIQEEPVRIIGQTTPAADYRSGRKARLRRSPPE